eukprot:NODE_90_length_21806_cov_0.389137.p3 type:complete len:570 gc:universal NODE_90_length_21806_cov_0.389137:17541-15832(-)
MKALQLFIFCTFLTVFLFIGVSMTQTSHIEDLQFLLQQSKNLNSYATNIANIYSISKKLSAQAPPASKPLEHLNSYQNAFHKRRASKLDKTQELEQQAILKAFHKSTLKYEQFMIKKLDSIYNKVVSSVKENAIVPKQPTFDLKISGDSKFASVPINEWYNVNKSRLWHMVHFIIEADSTDSVINKSKQFLEKEFIKVMETLCERQHAIAKVGNNFTTKDLVLGYFKVKHLEDKPSHRSYFLIRTGESVNLQDLELNDPNDPYDCVLHLLRGDAISKQQQDLVDRHVHNTWEHYFWYCLYLYSHKLLQFPSLLDLLVKGSNHDKALKCFAIGEYGLALTNLLDDPNYALDAVHIALYLFHYSKLPTPENITLGNVLYDPDHKVFHISNLLIGYLPFLSFYEKMHYLLFLIPHSDSKYQTFVQSQVVSLLVHCTSTERLDLLNSPVKLNRFIQALHMNPVSFNSSIIALAANLAFTSKKIEVALFLWDYCKDYSTVISKLNDSLVKVIMGVPLYTFQKQELIALSERYIREYTIDRQDTKRLLNIVYFKECMIEENYTKALQVVTINLVF